MKRILAICIPFFVVMFLNPQVLAKDNAAIQFTKDFSLMDFQRGCHDELPEKYLDNLCRLAYNLQIIQDHLPEGKKIKIISGYRSPRCNKRVSGAKKSQHMRGKAADIRVKGMSTKRLKRLIERLIKEDKIADGGVGLYRRHVHYDVRDWHARWKKIRYQGGVCD
ncbi:hypothetical protein CL614_07420 [archaeon]|nr:hypothetical protein [archaeon]